MKVRGPRGGLLAAAYSIATALYWPLLLLRARLSVQTRAARDGGVRTEVCGIWSHRPSDYRFHQLTRQIGMAPHLCSLGCLGSTWGEGRVASDCCRYIVFAAFSAISLYGGMGRETLELSKDGLTFTCTLFGVGLKRSIRACTRTCLTCRWSREWRRAMYDWLPLSIRGRRAAGWQRGGQMVS